MVPQHRSFDAMSGILGWILGLVRQEFTDFSLEGKRALEIGTGQYLNHPFGLYICGCKEVVTVDKEDNLLDISAPMENIVLARRFLSPFVCHDEFTGILRDIEDTGYDLERLRDIGIKYHYASNDFLDILYCGNSADFVFSYTTLEHVSGKELRPLLDVTMKALKLGGICAHLVDLEDHRDPKKSPFAFLSEPEWASENRLRFSSWRRLFDRHTLDKRYPYVAVRYDKPLPAIDPSVEYTNEEDLRTTAFLMVGRKINKTIVEGNWPDEDTWIKKEYLESKDSETFRKEYLGEWGVPWK